MILFKYFRLSRSVFSEFWAGQGTNRTVFEKNQESVFQSYVPNTFSFVLGSNVAGRSAQT